MVTPAPVTPGWRGEAHPADPVPVPWCNVYEGSAYAAQDDLTGGTYARADFVITSRRDWPGGPYSSIQLADGTELYQDGPAVRARMGVRTRHWLVGARRYETEAK